MKRAINICVLTALIFMILIFVLPYIGAGGILYLILYSLTFVIPFVIAMLLTRRFNFERREQLILSQKDKIWLCIPLVFSGIAVIMAASYLTSEVLAFFDLSYVSDLVSDNITYIFFAYIILPAFGEEILFRYIPLKLISPYSPFSALMVSAILFSAAHANVFQIPYAFIAGAIFAFADIVSRSILPSVLMHILNNTLSVFLMMCTDMTIVRTVVIIVTAAAVASIAFIIAKNKDYKYEINEITSHGGRVFTNELTLFSVFALIIAISSAIRL